MKAVICTKYGPPEVLKVTDIPKPSPKSNEILVKVKATNVTSGDIRIRAFDVPKSYWIPARLMLGMFRPRNKIPGRVFAGEVAEVGEKVTKFKIGDKVFGGNEYKGGTYSEFLTISEDESVDTIPEGLTFEEAAALVWGTGTSLYFLEKAKIKPGQEVLVYGVSGSLGVAAVQIAKYMAANVTGVCSAKNIELVKSLGADDVIDYTSDNFWERSKKYDVVFDTVGKAGIKDAVSVIEPNGFLLHSVGTPANMRKIKKSTKRNGDKI